MNINHIKNKIKELIGFKIKIKVSLGRNKYEYYEGEILKMHSNLFVVDTNKGIKSFTYSDVATKGVSISKFN